MSNYGTSAPLRAPVYGHSAVATSHPLATAAGIEVLLAGGNAADAAVAVGAALAVTEPCANGLGGDLIALAYTSKDKQVTSIMGNGASPAALDLSHFPLPSPAHASAVTVPGNVRAWSDIVQRFGTKPLANLLQPAIRLAKDGFPVGPRLAAAWKHFEDAPRKQDERGVFFLGNERRTPRASEIFVNQDLARVLESIAENGDKEFYEGDTAERIVAAVQERGGAMTMADMRAHQTRFEPAIATSYRGYTVHESGPPTHGAAALLALNIAENFNIRNMPRDEAEYLHTLIESTRLAYSETSAYLVDPECGRCRVTEMLDKQFAHSRAKLVSKSRCEVRQGGCLADGGTVQYCVVDEQGNAFSVVQSNYRGFGTGIVPQGCGFSLNNRGLGFNMTPGHPNRPAGAKRPYHTIIAGLLTHSGTFRAAFGVMGSYMQPQGHLQLVTALVDHDMDAQRAVDAHRFRVTGPFSACEGDGIDEVLFAEDIDDRILAELKKRGHVVRKINSVGPFGRAQIITRSSENAVLCAGSDSRADGIAIALPRISMKD